MLDRKKSVLTVTQLVRRVRNLLEIELGELWVEGEVSNLRKQASGHFYFSLKDEHAQLPAVMFRGRTKNGGNHLADGKYVRLFGEATVYEAAGRFQILVQKVEDIGLGELQAKFEALKSKLNKEGLFDQAKKKSLPPFPKAVGLVTSASGAALQDMRTIFARRAPWIQLVLFPVQVQGKGAERGIAQAIRALNAHKKYSLPKVDVLIVGRGGGSLEDLWNFNEELVARAIADSEIPVVSAVGHEIDFTIADFVSDLRAPTPSAAAELVAPDGEMLKQQLRGNRQQMLRAIENRFQRAELLLHSAKRGVLSDSADRVLREKILDLDTVSDQIGAKLEAGFEDLQNRVDALKYRLKASHPSARVHLQSVQFSNLRDRLRHQLEVSLEKKAGLVLQSKSLLQALGPQSAFNRGFSITLNENGAPVTSIQDLTSGDKLKTIVADGEIDSIVQD